MSDRLHLLRPSQLDEAQCDLHEQITGGPRSGQPFQAVTPRGELLGPFNALLYVPELGGAVQRVGEHLRFGGALPARLRELVILAVAAEAGSAYEWYAHSRVARTVGVTHAECGALARTDIPVSCEEREALALRLAATLPQRVPDELYVLLQQHFDEAELAELAVLVGYYRLLAGVLGTFDVPAPENA